MKPSLRKKPLLAAAVFAVWLVWSGQASAILDSLSSLLTASDAPPSVVARGGAETIEAAFQAETSGVWVEGSGVVSRLLSDDEEGDRHQRFILRLATGRTLLVSHNIDLAPRLASLDEEDTVMFRGRYEWNEQGGVLHWTHHDPQGNLDGGWLEAGGVRYR